ncbi:MAG: extensin family protein [Proteobacteria bacterium]|nr:extensin family protein [Pseudomonadota bacterium]
MRIFALVLVALTACSPSSDVQLPGDSGDTGTPTTTGPYTGPTGFIGSPCETSDDCGPDGAVCLTQGFPDGMCSLACDQFCPDQDGHPTTFCVAEGELPPEADALGDGACASRCDFGLFPDSGCREGYGCGIATRANEPGTQNYTCLPGIETELSDCYADLAARDVAFEPAIIADRSPDTHPDLTCHVEDPLFILGDVHGIGLAYSDDNASSRTLAACDMAHALVDTIDDVAEEGVTMLRHYGTYNCRVISGTNTLSRHSFGDAIDISGFDFADGSSYTLYDDWEHDTTTPITDAGQFLYNAAYRWHDAAYWNIILTPNYNAAHDDHFHIDLTPGSDYIRAKQSTIGPNLTGD